MTFVSPAVIQLTEWQVNLLVSITTKLQTRLLQSCLLQSRFQYD